MTGGVEVDQRNVELAPAGVGAGREVAEPRKQLLHDLASTFSRAPLTGADNGQREKRSRAAEQRRFAGISDGRCRGVEELRRAVGVPGNWSAPTADEAEPRARAARRGVAQRLNPRSAIGERHAPARAIVFGEEPLAAGAGPATARNEPGVTGKLAQVAANDEHVTRHVDLPDRRIVNTR